MTIHSFSKTLRHFWRVTIPALVIVAMLATLLPIKEASAAIFQLDISTHLNADVVVNVNDHKIDTDNFTVSSDAKSYMTQTAVQEICPEDQTPHGLPDDGFFPATAYHPAIQLPLKNSDDGRNSIILTRFFSDGSYNSGGVRPAADGLGPFDVPNLNYTNIHLFGASIMGHTNVALNVFYTDGTHQLTRVWQIPDWQDELPGQYDNKYYLIDGLDVTGCENTNDQAIFGVRFPVDSTKIIDYFDVHIMHQTFTGRLPRNAAFLIFGMLAVADVTTPHIIVEGNNTPIADGDTTPSLSDYTQYKGANWDVTAGQTLSRTYKILNAGDGVLNLTGTPRVSITGADAALFTVTSQPALATLPPGGGTSTTFTIQYAPVAPGTHTATVSIANDDPDKAPFDFTIQGTAVGVTPPAVTVNQSAAQTDPTTDPVITFTAVFSNPINPATFTASDVTIGGTAPGTKTVTVTEVAPFDHTTFVIDVEGFSGDGTVTASIGAGLVSNVGGLTNPASTSTDDEVTYNQPPGADVTIEQAAGQADPTSSEPIHFTVTFNDFMDKATFTGSDVVVGGTAPGTKTVVVSGDLDAFDIAVSGMTGSGTVTVSLPYGVVQGLVDPTLVNAASASTDNTVTFQGASDNTPPTVTVNQASGQADPTGASPIRFTAVFSEPINVSTFAAADVAITGTGFYSSKAITQVAPNDDTTFEITVYPTADGTFIADIPAATFKDAAGNDNTAASTSTDKTVTYDHGVPTVSSTTLLTDYPAAGPSTFDVTFSEAMQSPAVSTAANYLLVEIGADHVFDTVSCQDGLNPDDTQVTVNSVNYNAGTQTATLNINGGTALPNGTYKLFVCDTLQDLAGNQLNGGSDYTFTFVVGGSYPVVVATSLLTGYNPTGRAYYNFQFSRAMAVPGVETAANYLLVEAGANGAFDTASCSAGLQGDDQSIPVNAASYLPATETATLTVNGGTELPVGTYRAFACITLQDLAGNNLNGSRVDYTRTFYVDSSFPTVPSNSLVPTYILKGPSQFTVTFSEDMNNPKGDKKTNDVTNPNNYMLFEEGSTANFQTTACNAVSAKDDRIIVTGVTYTPNTSTVTLASALPVGKYKLFVCGTTSVVDRALNHLYGGLDYQYSFKVLQQKLYFPLVRR